jgi:hypothetical protein
MKIIIDVYKDYVIICDQIVNRPSAIPPSHWIEFFERMKGLSR